MSPSSIPPSSSSLPPPFVLHHTLPCEDPPDGHSQEFDIEGQLYVVLSLDRGYKSWYQISRCYRLQSSHCLVFYLALSPSSGVLDVEHKEYVLKFNVKSLESGLLLAKT